MEHRTARSFIVSFVALLAMLTAAQQARAQISMVRTPPLFPTCAGSTTATAIGSACDLTVAAATCGALPNTNVALVVDGTGAGGAPRAVILGGDARYTTVTVRNCGRVYIKPFNRGGDPTHTGILRLIAQHVTIDATSAVVGDGAGYAPDLCRDGDGPGLTTAGQPLGGFGGCRLADSAGGGGHFGLGGRGTTDCATSGCLFPGNWEQACPGALPAYSTPTAQGATVCPSTTSCRTGTGTLSNAGLSYFHSIYTLTMGAAGGDAGCRDNDGFDHYTATQGFGVGGFGGGGLAIVGLVGDGSGTVDISGYVTARGGRGCAWDNDSGGGGAGGSVLIVGDTVNVTPTAVVDARGGPGGSGVSTGGGNAWWNACGPSNSSLCDDCGGGGGGGIINVQSRSSSLSTSAFFLADGGPGGGNFDGCTVCQGEAGGGAGEIQLDGAYTGEVCDGFDNDFNGTADNGFGNVACGIGTCATSIPACMAGAPPTCSPAAGPDPSCAGSRGTARPRVAIIVDSSGSMLGNLPGTPSFGDGSSDHPGIDLNGDGVANDSRLFLAKDSLSQLISAYPEIDFALARYHQDEGLGRACQTAKWFECGGNCCSYDNPRNGSTTSPTACVLTEPTTTTPPGTVTLTVHDDSTLTNHCINYAGTCGAPRRGADILVGFESDVRQYLRWLDGTENSFDATTTPGNFCNGLAGNCELRATGPTPLAGSLQAVQDYVTPIQAIDPAAACRGYSVILVSDGGEDCGGDPAAAAAALYAAGVRTYVIGVSVDATQGATLNAIAAAGHTGTFTPVNSPDQLLPALTRIVSGSVHTEVCNGLDDNCNGLIDEGFNVGAACDNGMTGVCRGTGHLICNPTDVHSTVCQLGMAGGTSHAETCNGVDDNCNGLIDEGDPGGGGACGSSVGTCHPGVQHCEGGTQVCVGATGPSPETCDGLDNDCDGTADNGVPAGGPCGSAVGECRPGLFVCAGAMGYVCQGNTGPGAEVCDGLDNDCNGVVDDNVPGTGVPCTSDASGNAYCMAGVVRCLAGALRCQGATPYHAATCTCTPDPCASAAGGDGGSGLCPSGSACIACSCRTPCAQGEFPCSGDLVCRDGFCVPSECGGRFCADTETCVNNACVDVCATLQCPTGQACTHGRCLENNCYALGCPTGQVCRGAACVADPCAGVTCAADQFCREGTCVTTCDGVQCQVGQSCRSGACVADPCSGVTCPAGQVCSSGSAIDAGAGSCVNDPCANISCGTGRSCQNGACADDPCAGVHCPGDATEVVCRNGQCVSRTATGPAPARDRVVASGGGGANGCSVSTPGATPRPRAAMLGGVAALAVVLGRRRRERGARKGSVGR